MRTSLPVNYTQRRAPVQARGERRVDAILDAAAALIAEVGYEEITLRAVAKRSGAAIGSIYHFFPDKEALVNALLERVVAGIRELFPTVLTPKLERGSVASFVHGMIDPIARFAIQHPEVPVLMGRLFDRVDTIDVAITNRFDVIVRAGIQLIAAAGPASQAATQAEVEIALIAYLSARLRRSPNCPSVS